MWRIEQERHLAEHGPRSRDVGDLDAAVRDLELALDEDVELAGLFALGEENAPGRER
jgi:hypothetical protein